MTKLFSVPQPRISMSGQDGDLWHDARQALREQYPNPQRTDCPGDAVLRRLVRHNMSLEEAENWLDHFSRCSPCFCDFEKLQSRVRRKRNLVWAVATSAAVIFVCSVLALWKMAGREKKNSHTNGYILAQQSEPAPVALHFETASTIREPGPESDTGFQHLPNKAILLSIYLPPGSEAGKYEIGLFRSHMDSVPQAKWVGMAKIAGATTVLSASTQLSGVQPGSYLLAFRPTQGRWRYFQVMVP